MNYHDSSGITFIRQSETDISSSFHIYVSQLKFHDTVYINIHSMDVLGQYIHITQYNPCLTSIMSNIAHDRLEEFLPIIWNQSGTQGLRGTQLTLWTKQVFSLQKGSYHAFPLMLPFPRHPSSLHRFGVLWRPKWCSFLLNLGRLLWHGFSAAVCEYSVCVCVCM